MADDLVDPNTVQGVPVRKTLILVNHFVVSTTTFLNHFAALAEKKLHDVSRSLSRLDVEVKILEAKLGSVGGLDNIAAPKPSVAESAPLPTVDAAPPAPAPAPAAAAAPGAPAAAAPAAAAAAPAAGVMTIKDDPVYSKFFKLLRMGMPIEHIRLKMKFLGLNPDYIDTPDAPSPNAPAGGGGAPPAAAAAAAAPPAAGAPPAQAAATSTALVPAGGAGGAPAEAAAPAAPEPAPMKVSEDPMYAKYFKLLRMHVPKMSLKQKMTAEGLDPSIIDMNPHSPSPNANSVVMAPAEEEG